MTDDQLVNFIVDDERSGRDHPVGQRRRHQDAGSGVM